ncbi:MAG: hypothetical protein JO218_05935 [Burkholderiales bacterium]|nr:hypothetical protein [Burkholderiales bacterium]
MRRLQTRLGGLALCCFAALLPSPSVAANPEPTVQALLAEADAELVNQVLAWNRGVFALPDDVTFDPPLRDALAQLAQDHLVHLRALLPVWIAEERAAAKNPALRGAELAGALYRRSINELAIWSVESAGPAHDEAWLKAALAPTACRDLSPGYFAQRAEHIQAAPADARSALLAAEKVLLSRWGTQREGLAARPTAAEMAAADQAVARLREGLPVAAVPMTPFLAGQLFSRDRKPGKPDRWEQCAKSQWWLQSQLADGRIDRKQALTVYRYSTMLDAADFVPPSFKLKVDAAREAEGKPGYPLAATYFKVEGTVSLLASTDEQGRAFNAEIAGRQLRVPGVRGNRPLAFETLLDDASIDYARRRSYPVGKAGQLQFVMQWSLSEDSHGAQ